MKWQTADGRVLEIKEITDDHLKNIIRHMRQRSQQYPPDIRDIFALEAFDRGIPVADCAGDPVPWRDPRDGKLKTFSDIRGGYIEIKEH